MAASRDYNILWAGQAQTNDLPTVEMADTRTNYAPHVSGKDITNKDSIHGESLRAGRVMPAAKPKTRKSHRSQNLTVYR